MDRLSSSQKILLVLAALGVAAMSYLTYVHYKKDGSTLCDLAPGFSCEIVNKSIYAEIFGVPVSVMGLAYFLAVIVLVLGQIRGGAKMIELFTLGALVFSLYLTGLEIYLLASICVICEFAKVLMLCIFGVTHRGNRRVGARIGRQHLAALTVGSVGTIALYFIQR